MNKIYKVVWNAARGCYVVASELVKTHQGKKSTRRGGSILSRAGNAIKLSGRTFLAPHRGSCPKG